MRDTQRIAAVRVAFDHYARASVDLVALIKADPEAAVEVYVDLSLNRPGNEVSLASMGLPTLAASPDVRRMYGRLGVVR